MRKGCTAQTGNTSNYEPESAIRGYRALKC
jgi:hypothetical protein